MAQELAKVSEGSVAGLHRSSPGGSYESELLAVSQALTIEPRAAFAARKGDRPFEVDLVRLPAGKRFCPLHGHSTMWEYYIFLSGKGRVLQESGDPPIEVQAGDHVVQPPGWAHTVEADQSGELVYYIVSDNPGLDAVRYPNTGKWLVSHPIRKVFRVQECDYFEGEE